MATSTKIQLTTNEKPAFFVAPLRKDSADKVSELLQENHEKHHIYFNDDGFHNHIVHHLLTLYALGASPSAIQQAYDHNATYQRPSVPLTSPTIAQDLSDRAVFAQHLGSKQHYRDFLAYFQAELERKGVAAVLQEHLFTRGDARAEDLLARLFAGFLHPLIHVGFGVEFAQPAIVAEGLAQAATHDAWIGAYLRGAEDAAAEVGDPQAKLPDLLQEVRATEQVAGAARWSDGNRLRDGVMARAGEAMCRIAGRWVVGDDASDEVVERKTAEMIDAAVFLTTTAQRPPHIPKLDFLHMHAVTTSIFFTSFLTSPLLPRPVLPRLLEWKARTDLALYASRGAPQLLPHELRAYVPAHPDTTWPHLFERAAALSDDDGHAAKLVRALAAGERACAGRQGCVVGGKREWLLAGAMGLEAVGAGGPRWVRSAGMEEAWRDVPVREGGRGAAAVL
ncbi:hypothetical protein BKCO1_3400021 [Neofusicoccum parvum]|uniref:Uncharacterized protein n=1 Tax=Neofusicoccum parvum TaxID=310453 RepID=A0ACB5SE10_9PEZI|nr:hypothetical protein BKCO1_3400021 [Neofusicoccum parvum]